MNRSFTLPDALSAGDLATYLGRAGRVEDGSVRLIAGSGVLAAYTAILYPHGLLDSGPTVLGLRTLALAERTEFDAVVPVKSLLDRLGRGSAGEPESPVTVTLPTEVSTVTWAGISPPRGGWKPVHETSAGVLEDVARQGIDAVAEAVPDNTGEQIVRRVRSEVWGRLIEEIDLPAGAAFAAFSLGFLGDDRAEPIPVYEAGSWSRLTSRRGHVLVRRRSWSLLG